MQSIMGATLSGGVTPRGAAVVDVAGARWAASGGPDGDVEVAAGRFE
ncbi:MAG: hypothetical protein Tsb0020_18490 [Haliangiales bacterium]